MYERVHPADRDLIMAADGELPSLRKVPVAAHLESRWSCRKRMGSVESAIAEFVRASRALLRRGIWDFAFCTVAFCVLAVIAATFESTASGEGPGATDSLTPGERQPITIAEFRRKPDADIVASVRSETAARYSLNTASPRIRVTSRWST